MLLEEQTGPLAPGSSRGRIELHFLGTHFFLLILDQILDSGVASVCNFCLLRHRFESTSILANGYYFVNTFPSRLTDSPPCARFFPYQCE